MRKKQIDNLVFKRYTEENKSATADTKGEMNDEFIKRGNCSITE